MPAAVSALNSVDLPTLGSPTIPHLMPIESLGPRCVPLRRCAAGVQVLRLACMQPVRRPLGAFLDEDRQQLDGLADRLEDLLLVLGGGAVEDMADDLVAPARSRMADADPKAPERGADMLHDVPDAVVPCMPAVELQLGAAGR